MYTTHFKYIK